jgi:type III secretory pathway component EscU
MIYHIVYIVILSRIIYFFLLFAYLNFNGYKLAGESCMAPVFSNVLLLLAVFSSAGQ